MSRRRLGRVLRLLAAVVLLVVLIGATYQGVTTAVERRRHPFPGRLVDVGGYQLHLYCTGSGAPTVVLEAPAVGMSAAWGWVQPAVAEVTRTCVYDRAGLGWSEAGGTQFEPEAVPRALHALLGGAGERGPYILAGQGLGAQYAQVFAARYPSDAAALVLVDAPRETAPGDASTLRLLEASPWLARVGLLRATRVLSVAADGLPDGPGGALRAFLNRPDHLTRAARELAQSDTVAALAADAPPRTGLPVTHVETSARGGIAFLTSRADADRVVAAVREAVQLVRGGVE
jgi:pimeloyl-ACP methyl ester carboxylesterase